MDMPESLAQKFLWLSRKLEPYAEKMVEVRSVGEGARWAYRDRVCLSTAWDNAQWNIGLRRRDEVLHLPKCPVQSPIINNTLAVLLPAMPAYEFFPLVYYVQSKAILTLVLKKSQNPSLDWLTNDVKQALYDAGLRSLYVHLNPSAGMRVFGKPHWYCVWGNERVVDQNGMWYGPASFHQQIQSLYEQSLDEALRFFNIKTGDIVVDLYCGNGNSMKKWAMAGAKVVGVELMGDAVECAKLNIPEALVLRGSCKHRIPQVNDWVAKVHEKDKQRLLYVNPPRTGLEAEVVNWIIKQLHPDKIGYLSCSAGTLNRDLAVLTNNGYMLDQIIPFDFFPQTLHVETLVLLNRIP